VARTRGTGVSWKTCSAPANERTDVELLVRLPDTDPTLVRKALDLGARNVFLPRVETAEEVRDAVRSARFRYDDGPGDRGLASPRASRWGLADEYVTTEDRETLVGVTVETEASVENLDDILAVPSWDSSLSARSTSRYHSVIPVKLIIRRYGKPSRRFDRRPSTRMSPSEALFGMDDVNEKAGNGYQMLNLGSTTGALKQTVTGWFDAYEQNDA